MSASHLTMLSNLSLHFTGALQICKCIEYDTELVGWQVLRLVIPAVDSPEDIRVRVYTIVEVIRHALTS